MRFLRKILPLFFATFAISLHAGPGDSTHVESDVEVEEIPVIIPEIPGFSPEFDFYYKWDSNALDPYRMNLRTIDFEIPVSILDADCGYKLPILGRVNSGFGWRHGRPHQGIDLQLRTGDSVQVAFDGVVRMSRWYSGYGNCVIVRHYNGFETLYGHLSKRIVKTGDLVNAGQVLGLGGSTGHSTGPHLHFETRFLGRPIDPANIIDFKGDSLVSEVLVINKTSFGLPNKKGRYYYKKGKRGKYYKHSKRHKRTKIKPTRSKRIKKKIRKPRRRRR